MMLPSLDDVARLLKLPKAAPLLIETLSSRTELLLEMAARLNARARHCWVAPQETLFTLASIACSVIWLPSQTSNLLR